jgi:hypothetical protein
MLRRVAMLSLLGAVAAPVRGQAPSPALTEARDILREMVSTNTTLGEGDVTPLAEGLAARFREAGVPAGDVQVIGPTAKNKNLVVRIRRRRTLLPQCRHPRLRRQRHSHASW